MFTQIPSSLDAPIRMSLSGWLSPPPKFMVNSNAVPASFEAALAELDAIVATMESGQLPLKESLASYKRGAELLQYCQAALKDAEQQVQLYEKGILKAFDSSDGEIPSIDES